LAVLPSVKSRIALGGKASNSESRVLESHWRRLETISPSSSSSVGRTVLADGLTSWAKGLSRVSNGSRSHVCARPFDLVEG